MQHDRPRELIIPDLDVPKAKRYSRAKLSMFLLATGWRLTRMAWFARRGRSARLRDRMDQLVPDRRLAGPSYIATTEVLTWLSALPVAYLGGHLLERRFELTKQSGRGWFGDQIKGLLLGLALQVPLTGGVFAIIRRRPHDWWLILAGMTVPLSVLFGNLAPVLIMPLFNRFEPVRDEELRRRIQRLADGAGIRIAGVFTMDMSRQTEKPNAFFTGLGNTKRIVLSDTLVDRFEPDEVDAVVAHELGHQVHGDIWRMIGFGGALGFGGAYLLHRLAPALVARTASQTNVERLGDEASLPLLGLVLTVIGLATAPLQAAFSRQIERRTDQFALEATGRPDAYASAMIRLATHSLSDPDPPPIVVFFLYSHPPIAERIAAAQAYRRQDDSVAPNDPSR